MNTEKRELPKGIHRGEESMMTKTTFSTTDAAFKWYRKMKTTNEEIVEVAGKRVRFFRDSRGLIDSEIVRDVKCLDCGAMVPYGQPCTNCGLGA